MGAIRTEKGKRAAAGTVQILSTAGRLQLRYTEPSRTRRVLSLRLPDSALNRKAAELKAREIEKDLALGTYTTHHKYNPRHLQVVEPVPSITLEELWFKYNEFRSPQISPSTLKLQYGNIPSD